MTARRLGEAVRLGVYDPGSPDWLAMRARRIGGSEIGAVLGISEYESPFSLWHRKADRLGPVDETDIMTYGKVIEDAIVELWSRRRPEYRIRRAGTYVHRSRDFQLSSPDRVLGGPDGPELLEVKSSGDRWKWGDEGSDDVPPGYLAQARWQLDTFGYRRCRFAVLFSGRPPVREFVVEHDQHDADLMRAAAAEFIRTLDADEVPDIDGHSATWQAVREMHPDIDDRDIEIDPATAARYRAVVADAKAADELKRLVSGELVTEMAGARRAVLTNPANPAKPEVVARREPYRDAVRLVPVASRAKTGAPA